MSIIGKEKEPNKVKEAETNKMLTPWQKENLKYAKRQGEIPKWQENEPGEQPIKEEKESQYVETMSDSEKDQEFNSVLDYENQIEKETFNERFHHWWTPGNKKLVQRLTLIISILLFAIMCVSYFISPYSKLQKINVVGRENVSASNVYQASGFKVQESLWGQYLDKNKAIARIKKDLPKVKTAKVSITHLNQFTVQISEYKQVGYLQSGDQYQEITENAKIITGSVKKTDNYPTFKNFKEGSSFTDLIRGYQKMDAAIKKNVVEVLATPSKSNPYLFTMNMKDGNQIIASTKDFTTKIIYYPKIASQMQEKGIVDMEAGIFSYPYGNNTNKSEKTD
ncbi:cell division protein FtsQ/DivIB [Vagococcus entomophilus]|uniref:Cell division protein DivIB n=1 Tax=Vagococcus entomophilus TaxID=1160095 RepID=A0A430AIK0_9ENTE|nr:FtsQ-type POTRA domain-containing protein [Vagococcus entomophilus]RSU07833.1 hypothetical protein CBF30_00915 [Vagococcus entomophilus]